MFNQAKCPNCSDWFKQTDTIHPAFVDKKNLMIVEYTDPDLRSMLKTTNLLELYEHRVREIKFETAYKDSETS